MKKKLVILSGFALSFAPFVALAQNTTGCDLIAQQGFTSIQSFICTIGNILDTVIPVLVILGVVYFVWGVITYVISSDEEAKKAGRDRIIYGIIGLVVIVGMWGLVHIVMNTFGLDTGGGAPAIPTVGL